MTLTLTVCILSKLDQIAPNSASNSIKECCSHAAKKQINRYFKLSPNRMRNNHTLNQFSNNIGHHPDFFLATSFSLLDGSNKIKPRKRKAEPFERIILNQTYYLYVRGLWTPFNWENDQQAGSGEQAYNWLAPNSARGDLSEFTSPSNGNCLENFVAGERLTFPSEQPFALIDFILQRNKAWWIHKEAINCPWIFKIFDDDTLRVWQKNTVQCLTNTRPSTVVEIIE